MNAIPNNVLRQIFLIVLIILLGILVFSELKTFIPAFLGALTLYVLMRKYMFILQEKYRWKTALAASLLMLLSFLIILLPIFVLINMMDRKNRLCNSTFI
jgi:predicted PurR-regulated permease PerM